MDPKVTTGAHKEQWQNQSCTSEEVQAEPIINEDMQGQMGEEIQITEEYVRTALFKSAQHMIEAGTLIKPFNDMFGSLILGQADTLITQLQMFEEMGNDQSINNINIPDDVKEEVDSLIDSLKDSIGEL